MKILVSIGALFFSLSAFACPDISGVYVSKEGTYLKYVQQACGTLTRYLGEEAQDGSISFPAQGMDFPMNGVPQCGIRDFCTTVTAFDDRLVFKLNFTGGVQTDNHGNCDQNGYSISVDSATGNLLAEYDVFNCVDKFAGTAQKTFTKK